ncbi:MAG: class I SAM-dependent methyltransferase [Bacteroidetes bacterium]|nr:class I SAM-dependent methyltransferase [Bacteroidota bacterium]MBS1972938.1 class I SAM-dependent methyltransferase [Bacteroidota bacterium]
MDIQTGYDNWSSQYDSNNNKTRDLEAIVLRKVLENIFFATCLEIGCGTGKNTEWLAKKARHLTAIDFSDAMLAKAKQKINSPHVAFRKADINAAWHFAEGKYDLITFSLVLEHIENLDHVFENASNVLSTGGHIYIGELHPFKQYSGSKARFETETGMQVVPCFIHHVSDFTQTAKKFGLELVDVNEYFDDDRKASVPRILMAILRKEK